MREYNSIISDIEQYLKTRLEENTEKNQQDYQNRKLHFQKLQELMQEGDYLSILGHIQSGIKLFHQYLYKTRRYHDYLVKLEKIFKPDNEKDKHDRQTKLIAAILSDDPDKIKDALNNGGYAVITDLYHDENNSYVNNQTPLAIALNQSKYKSVDHLLSIIGETGLIKIMRTTNFLSEITVNNKNPVIIPMQNNSLLHFAVSHNLTDILEVLLEQNIDLNVKNAENKTALDIACEKNNETLAIELIYHGADVKINNPLQLAVENNNVRLANKIIKAGALVKPDLSYDVYRKYKNDSTKYRDLYKLFKKPFSEKKHSIIANKSVIPTFFKPAIITKQNFENEVFLNSALCSQIYIENDMLKKITAGRVQYLIQQDKKHNNLLNPLMKIVAMSSIGIRRQIENENFFKTIVNNEKNVMNLAMGAKTTILGRYRKKNTVFVGGKNLLDVFGIILHEWKHYVDNEVFGSVTATFPEQNRKQFNAIKDKLFFDVHKMPENTSEFLKIKSSFAVAILSTDQREILVDAEILARVPEVIGILGHEDGINWLKTYTPKLFEFYQTVYNPALEAYIQKKFSEIETLQQTASLHSTFVNTIQKKS
jgi:ankyrin repeat protein